MAPEIKYKIFHILTKESLVPTSPVPSPAMFHLFHAAAAILDFFLSISDGSHTLSYHITFILSLPFTQNALPLPHSIFFFFFAWITSTHLLGLSWLSDWPGYFYLMVPQNSGLVTPDTCCNCNFLFSVCLPEWTISSRLNAIGSAFIT